MLGSDILIELLEFVEVNLSKIEQSAMKAYKLENRIFSEDYYSIELEDFIHNNRKPSFNQTLFSFIDEKGTVDAEIYKKAGIDRRHFSKIRSNPNYRPGKNTVIALALALELDQKDTEQLLDSAGYTLSDSETFDLVIQFCLQKKIYNIHDVNQALDYFSLKPLGTIVEK